MLHTHFYVIGQLYISQHTVNHSGPPYLIRYAFELPVHMDIRLSESKSSLSAMKLRKFKYAGNHWANRRFTEAKSIEKYTLWTVWASELQWGTLGSECTDLIRLFLWQGRRLVPVRYTCIVPFTDACLKLLESDKPLFSRHCIEIY